jgi:hypothetical protein
MIRTLGRNGPKVIQVDMAPPPSACELHEVSAEILQLHDDMDKLHQIIAQKGDLDGVFNFAHKMIDKAKAFQEAVTQKNKQVVVHPNKVELPDKLYTELETIIKILVRLAEALMAANSETGPDDPATGAQASPAAAPPPMIYVIRGDRLE